MAKAEARPEAEKKGRKDTVRPPASLPEGSPFERMSELARRLLVVPKSELPTVKPKKRKRH